MRNTKYRIAFIAGIMVIIAVALFFYQRNSSHPFTQGEDGMAEDEAWQENIDSPYLKSLEKTFSQMSQEQLLSHKRSAEEAIEKLNVELKSDSLNPEEVHEAKITLSNIKQELKLIDKYLNK